MANALVDTRVAWPGGARCAVLLSFDFDAETLWIGRDKANWKRPGVLSHGRYGANLGVPKILETLEDAGVPATFFVPGWTAENHTRYASSRSWNVVTRSVITAICTSGSTRMTRPPRRRNSTVAWRLS